MVMTLTWLTFTEPFEGYRGSLVNSALFQIGLKRVEYYGRQPLWMQDSSRDLPAYMDPAHYRPNPTGLCIDLVVVLAIGYLATRARKSEEP